MRIQQFLPWLGLLLTLPVIASEEAIPDMVWNSSPANRACEAHLQQHHLSATGDGDALAQEFAEYEQLVEQALVYRTRTIEIGVRLTDHSRPLSGNDLQLLNEGMVAHLKLREALMRMAESHECWLSPPANLEKALTPEQRIEGVMLSLSAALVLYDNYLLAVTLFEENERLRRVLNDSNSGYGIGNEILSEISSSYNSIQNRARVRHAISFYEKQIRKLSASALAEPRMRYLNSLINQSPSYTMTKTFSPTYVIGRKLRFMERLTRDQLVDLGNGGTSLFSKMFGNTVGLVETRKGKLFNRAEVMSKVSTQLRAGDILLEKTPFRLTDALIPGYWGHAAVWIGTEAELRQLGLWDHALVVPHHEAIRNGAGVVEALRSGVELNPLSHFLNIDDLAALRARKMDDKGRATVILNAFRQIGKEYDFNFDVETRDRIVCSELIYVTHTGIDWPTTKTLGRATISPDQVAAKALPGGPLELVLLYQDGKPVVNQSVERLAHALGQKESAASLSANNATSTLP